MSDTSEDHNFALLFPGSLFPSFCLFIIPRVLYLKLPRGDRFDGDQLSEAELLQDLQSHLRNHPGSVTKVTMQHTPPGRACRGRGGRIGGGRGGNRVFSDWQEEQQLYWQEELVDLFRRHGDLKGVSMMPYRATAGKAGAIIR